MAKLEPEQRRQRPRGKAHGHRRELTLLGFLQQNRLNWLVVFVPVSVAVELLGAPKLWLFFTSALAIIPLAGIIGDATEELAHRTGPGLGGLLNATFGNATELIIGLFALASGLHELVKASISGSIIGNILLVLGLSMLMGGWGRSHQAFNRTRAGASTAMLFLAVVALVMPAVFDLAVFGTLEPPASSMNVEILSVLVAAVLMATYLASLLFSLKTHQDLITSVPASDDPRLGLSNSLLVLGAATAVTAMEAEFLVDGISVARTALGMTEFFMGVIVIAVVGNAAEHFSALTMAMKNRMELRACEFNVIDGNFMMEIAFSDRVRLSGDRLWVALPSAPALLAPGDLPAVCYLPWSSLTSPGYPTQQIVRDRYQQHHCGDLGDPPHRELGDAQAACLSVRPFRQGAPGLVDRFGLRGGHALPPFYYLWAIPLPR